MDNTLVNLEIQVYRYNFQQKLATNVV